eukprot:CAMPEP_0181184764 /NCGR_PEP_ID=MMETSP1096-20121128/9143_1 /TAXON_ID=156174 ORGANISM="Chrysochromulina ericina, Strain CCMP281" /NCGR_SAMPLE_ID=MMETSP1096 /ASSEMBLY_ACC=CAM_ASM_000453 /LENGTH=81 /DNA_ID=CAMNT_0023273553 /DNA_START=662 /DNA_END=904 /DNA_ORIENTATION=-
MIACAPDGGAEAAAVAEAGERSDACRQAWPGQPSGVRPSSQVPSCVQTGPPMGPPLPKSVWVSEMRSEMAAVTSTSPSRGS